MSDPVTIGIGMMIAGKVVENQEWFGEDFGKALMVGGAVVAMDPGGVFSPATAASGELGKATALEAVSADIPIGLAETGGAVGEAGLALGEPGLGAATEGAVTGVSDVVGTSAIDPSTSGLLSDTPAVEPSFLDSKWAAPSMMVGGQAVSGMMQAKSQEEIEADRRAEEERLRLARSSWGRTAGGYHVPLNVGSSMSAMSDRLFANRNNQQNSGGLLS